MAGFPLQPSVKHVYRNKSLEECLRKNKWYVQVESAGYRAGLDRNFCEEPEALDFIERIDTLMDGGQILKSGDTCYVSRVIWNGKDVVVKRYNHKGFIHSVRHTIKKSRALRGWLHGYRLGMLNIPAPRPLAYIEQYKGQLLWKSYLVTEYVEGQRLYDFLRDGTVGEGERSKVIEQIAELFGRLGKHRITHGDLKHTNILITGRRAVLTDLDGMKVHRFNWTHRIWRAKDVARFLRKADFSPALTDYCRTLIFGKSSVGGKFSGDFEKMHVSDWTIHVRKDFRRYDIANLILLNGLSAEGQGRFARVRSSDYTRVYRCGISFDGVEHVLYLKRYLYHSVWDFAKRLFRSSRAKSAFKASLMLERGRFDTPCVVGLFERRFGPFRTDNLLLTKEVKGSMKLGAYLLQFCNHTHKQRLQEKRRLIASFGETVGRMHAEGVFHGDLGQGNVLVQEEGRGWRFFFIDNERTKQFHRLPGRMRLKNLVQINMFWRGISNTDRMSFFKSYLNENPHLEIRCSAWAQKVITKTNRRLQRKFLFENGVPTRKRTEA
jgi:tRNA A-37 threonylcarbamoyl transferase component Bud32